MRYKANLNKTSCDIEKSDFTWNYIKVQIKLKNSGNAMSKVGHLSYRVINICCRVASKSE